MVILMRVKSTENENNAIKIWKWTKNSAVVENVICGMPM
jgi:hypothetical protein